MARSEELLPGRALVPTSARAELALLEAHRVLRRPLPAAAGAGALEAALKALDEQRGGERSAEVAKAAAALRASRRAVDTFGSTGVLDVISRCVALRPPALCFPVSSLGSLAPLATALAGATGSTAEAPAPLRDCLQMRPLSTVGDCFVACKRIGLCSGDFVRAEGSSAASSARARNGSGESGPSGAPASGGARASDCHRPLKKDDVLSTNNAILRLQSTKKSQWQQ